MKFKKYDSASFNSLEGKSNGTGIKYRNQKLKWNNLDIPIIIKKKDDYAKEALENNMKYCRILRKTIRGVDKYYIQLILEGVPPKKERTTKNQKVGLNIGTSSIAIVSNREVRIGIKVKKNTITRYLTLTAITISPIVLNRYPSLWGFNSRFFTFRSIKINY